MVKIDQTKFISCFLRGRAKGLIAIACVFLLSAASHATPAGAQQRISVELQDATLLDALREINRASGNQVLFKNEEVAKETIRITADLRGATVPDAVTLCLRGTGLACIERGDVVVVSPSAISERGPERQSPASPYTFSGIVYDQSGNPLVGATVIIQGTSIGAATGVDGAFSLRSPNEEVTLRVSYIGYTARQLTVKTGSDIVVTLEADATMFAQVVVTGYQNIRKERMTGTATTITASQIENRGFTTLEQVLNGTVSGVNLTATGRPGQDAQIMIRGANSLTGSTEPMWIVDGMPMQGDIPDVSMSTDLRSSIFTTGIGNIAPDDIRSITILKDAAATAIYGARAANGVIVIETKSGMEGSTRFSASANFGVTSRPSNNVDMMNSSQKILFEQQILNDQIGWIRNPGRVTSLMQLLTYQEITQEEADAELARLAGINTDWFREIFKPAYQQQYNFTMSGGDPKTQYYASLNYLDQTGIEPNNAYDRLSMNIKLTHSPNSRLHITGGVNGTIRNDRKTASVIDPLEYALYANPYERPCNDDGSYAYDMSWDPEESTLRDGLRWETLNAVEDMKRNTQTQRYLDLQFSLKLEWEIANGLMFTTHATYNANSSNTRVTEGAGTYTSFKENWLNTVMGEVPLDLVQGSLNEATAYSRAYTWRNTLQYSKDFNDRHYLTVFGGQEISGRTGYTSSNYFPVFDEQHRVGGYPDMSGIDGSVINFSKFGRTGKTVEKISSFFANASYSYMDRYIVSGSMRYDGSDIIGNDNQFTPLWNVSARWNIHRESFLENHEWINQASVRAGFGYTGSIDKDALPFLTMQLQQSLRYDGQLIPTSFSYPNYNIKWQTKQDFNVGLDLSLFDHRVEIGFNYYYNITRDVLDNLSLPFSSGRGVIKANVADIYNNGFEIDLGVTFLRSEELQWYGRFNVAYNNNEVRNTYYKSVDDLPSVAFGDGTQYVEGYPVGSWFGYKFAGVDPITGYALAYTGNGEATHAMGLGGTEWAQPRAFYLGKSIPPVTGGFSTSVNWKRFVMNINFEFKAGHKITSYNTFRSLDSKNRHTVDEHRWRQPGDISNIPQQSEISDQYSRYMYDSRLEKGDYLRCSYMNVGYNIDPAILSKIGFRTVRISLTANNLFTLSGYKGIDPSLMGRVDYPVSRSYILSLNLGF